MTQHHTARRVSLLLAVLASFVALVSVFLVNDSSQGIVLFDWSNFLHQQAHLQKEAATLTHKLADEVPQAVSPGKIDDSVAKQIEANGVSIDQGLQAITKLITTPRQPRAPARRKTMPMQQALEMIKVQDQMRREKRFPSDRIEGTGDAVAVVSEQDERDMRKLMGGTPQAHQISRLYENCRYKIRLAPALV